MTEHSDKEMIKEIVTKAVLLLLYAIFLPPTDITVDNE